MNQVLRSEVIDIFVQHVPAFQGLERGRVYDMVLNNPALAAQCYALFTHRPDLFDHLLVDRHGVRVADVKVRLSCGRSMQEVTAMVVRAVARRHFLKRFKPAPPTPPPAPPTDLRTRMVRLFRKPAPPPKLRRKATRGDSLYRALRHHLLYHWQLPLIPHYTPLPVSLVRQLGARILEFRSPGALKTLLKEGIDARGDVVTSGAAEAEPVAPQNGNGQLHAATRSEISWQGGGHGDTVAQAKMEAMWRVAKGLELNTIFAVDEGELRRMIMNASVASGSVITSLSAHGLKMRDLVVLLCVFERKFGKASLPAMFGPAARPGFIDILGGLMKTHGIGDLQDPEDIKNRVDVVIRQLQRANHLPR